MAKRGFDIFSMEGDESFGAAPEVEVEVAEVGDAGGEFDAEAGSEVLEVSDGIEEGMAAADELSGVEDTMVNSLDESGSNDGEGLPPVAVEAIQKHVEGIFRNFSADPSKTLYAIYATEAFASPSSRKANTRLALEGIREVIKELWKKIKEACKRLMDKAKAFWNNHVSSLGRVKKALESMKTKVGESSGKLKSQAYIEDAPTSLIDAFAGSNDISKNAISEYINTHKGVTDSVLAIPSAITPNTTESVDTVKSDVRKIYGTLEQASAKKGPFIGGVTIKITKNGEGTEDQDIEYEKETIDNKETKLGVSLSGKEDVRGLLNDVIAVINASIKFRDKQDKVNKEVSDFMLTMEKRINEISEIKDRTQTHINTDRSETTRVIPGTSDTDKKAMRQAMKAAYKALTTVTRFTTDVTSLNIKLAKAVINYAALCVKNYK